MYPSVITAFTNPNANNRLNAPSHSSIESAQNNGLTQVMNFVGTEGSTSTLGTLIYDVRSPASNGGGHVQTANKGGTGQTQFNKGDLLIAQSTSVLSKLAIGADGFALVADSTQSAGVKWGLPGNAPLITVYNTASTLTWTRPSVFNYIVVEVIGGGGGGAGTNGTGVSGSAGSGGGGGGYSCKVIPATSILASQNIIVAASALAGVGTGNGGSGNRSSFGTVSILSASGGVAGNGASGGVGSGAAGGVGSNGDINGIGGSGTPGVGWISGSNFVHGSGGVGGIGMYGFGKGGDESGSGSPGAVIITQY